MDERRITEGFSLFKRQFYNEIKLKENLQNVYKEIDDTKKIT